ncbi:MAG TPA: DUF3048 domain-containing protein [Candidatus Bathyarchaeia archaeon]|nr:DUF3048 domain-containing protein [Candidatus Bathyarchaeia archaeon]
MKKLNSEKIFLILAFLGIYLLSTGVSFAAFNFFRLKTPLEKAGTGIVTEEELLIEVSGPTKDECPLTGKMYTEAEKERWSGKRPLFVMVENHEEARPQSGLSKSDIVYEAVAEGGITRFGIVYLCDTIARETIIGPVRSARTYFLDWASEYGESPLYAHVGGAHCDPQTGEGCLNTGKADALGQIADYGWEGENDLNQFSIGYPTFWRDYERIGHTVATEHTMYSTTERLWSSGQDRGWSNLNPEGEDWQKSFVSWSFKDDTSDAERGGVNKIEFSFWQEYGDYTVTWDYDKVNNEYKRSNGGEAHLDLNNNQQLTAKNVVIQFSKESSANDGYPGNIHLLYGTIGEGKALVFQDGQAIKAKWSKASRKGRTEFTTESGKEIKFVRGRIWIEVLPQGNEAKY